MSSLKLQGSVKLTIHLPYGHNITVEYYKILVRKPHERLKMNRSKNITTDVRHLTHKSPVQKANESLNVVQSLRYQLLLHPPYSTDLVPSDIFLFKKRK